MTMGIVAAGIVTDPLVAINVRHIRIPLILAQGAMRLPGIAMICNRHRH